MKLHYWRRNMLNIFDVANYILGKNLPNMSHKKLQKLCYYVQAWSLAVKGEQLIDCKFQAWVHGPVCRELYDCCKNDINNVTKISLGNDICEDDREFIDAVLGMYDDLTGQELELLTHSEEPWKEARRGLSYWQPSTNVISDDAMAAYYLEEFKEMLGE